MAEAVPVGLWQRDWAPIYARLRELELQGITDSSTYFADCMEELVSLLGSSHSASCNRYCLQLLEVDTEAEAMACLSRLHEALPPALHLQQLANLVTDVTDFELEVQHRARSGQVKVLHMKVQVQEGDGERVSVLTWLFDVTGTRKLEASVERLGAELRQSDEQRDQFVYAASHDLQEPLRMVTSYSQLLAKRYGERLDERADKYIHYIVDGAKRMQALIGGLLKLSRISGDSMSWQPTEMEDILIHVISTLHEGLDACAGEVTFDPLPRVSGDRQQLALLLQQLLLNSLTFRDAERPPRVHVSVERSDTEYVFSVADNGIGIDREHAQDIFVIFRRLNRRDAYPGIGMGLPLSKRIVERHGGRIWWESSFGEGTVFYFSIPTAEV